MYSLATLSPFVSSSLAASVSETFLTSLRSPRPPAAQSSPARNRTCLVDSHDDGLTDDAASIFAAFEACNNGGHVLFSSSFSYEVHSPLNLTFLSNVDIDIQGTVSFSDDLAYWLDNSFDLDYQNATSFFELGGADVNVYGGGLIDGRGQKWYDNYPINKNDRRPVLFATVGMQGGSVSDLALRNSPFWHNFVGNSSNVVFTNMSLFSTSNNGNFEKNTDGWDIYRSEYITIQNSSITNGDDCVSFKPNTTNILVQHLTCNGTHGISVGSLGQYPERIDLVENIFVHNIAMYNSSEGARIKVWPNQLVGKSENLVGGGGSGLVRNVTYDTMFLDNVDYGMTITQCYGQDDEDLCFDFPSKLNITDITFRNIRGRTNRAFAPLVGHLVCSSPDTCSNIVAENIDIRTINGSSLVTCRNMENSLLDVDCTEWSKGYNPA